MCCDQFTDLPADAIAFLKENEVPQRICECCNRPYPRSLKVIGEYVGMFEYKYPLHRHQLKDGKHADEFLQAAPWSSGPCFFLGLRVFADAETTFEWSEEDINKA